MTLDVGRIRSSYPALSDGYAYLDGAAGTQMPSSVIEAISGAYPAGLGNLGGAFPASLRTGEIVRACRQAVADLVGGEPRGVILGPEHDHAHLPARGDAFQELGPRATKWSCPGWTTTRT